MSDRSRQSILLAGGTSVAATAAAQVQSNRSSEDGSGICGPEQMQIPHTGISIPTCTIRT